MSLVRYGDGDSRSVVLRHQQTLVLFDPQSRQIILRQAGEAPASPHDEAPGLQSCPFCHRPMDHHDHGPSSGAGRSGRRRSNTPLADSGFVDEAYFRMLDSSVHDDGAIAGAGPSLGRHLPQLKPEDTADLSDASSIDDSNKLPGSSGIASSAFSPGYFNRFFQQTKVLGKGGKGVVLLVEHVLDGVHLGFFACKRVPVGNDHEWLKKVLIEVQLLQKLSHQNLVSYRHVWLENVQLTNFGPKVPCAFILQQYCNAGDLQNYILGPENMPTKEQLKERMRRKSRGKLERPKELGIRKLPFDQIISFFRDIASGLSHLHSNGFIHRDLKPSNCLLHDTPGQGLTVLVSDFGEVQQVNQIRNSTGATGTISYCAPEVLIIGPNGTYGNFTEKSDVFSLGMILHFMCFGRLPYIGADSRHEENEDLDALRAEITAWKGLDDSKQLRSDLPERLYHSLKTLISPDPALRPSAADILLGIEIGIGEDIHAAGRRGSGVSGPHSTAKRSPAAIPSPAVIDDAQILSFRRISPVADTPPPGTPTRGSSVTDLAETTNNRSKKAKKPLHRGLRKGHVRASSLLAEEPISADSTRSSTPIDDSASTASSMILRPRAETRASLALGRVSGVLPRVWWRRYWNNPVAIMWTKLLVFLLKIIALNQPCVPVTVKPWAYYPLMGLAAMDFTMPMLSATLMLGFMHFVFVAALRWTGKLCAF